MEPLTVFIGSSSEACDRGIVPRLAGLLTKQDFKVLPWYDHDGFAPGEYTLDALLGIVKDVDLALFVFSKDDLGLYSALLRQSAYEPFSSLAWTFSAATVMSWAAVMAMPPHELGWRAFQSMTALTAVLINGVLVNGLSYVCWQRALRAAPMTFVAPWISLTPLVAAILASPHRPPTADRWTGIALVLVSVMLATLPAHSMAALGKWRRNPVSGGARS